LKKGAAMQTTLDQLKKELEKQQKFQQILAEVSADFISIPIDDIDANIKNSLRRICEFLDIDQATLFQWKDYHSRLLILTHLHTIPEGSKFPEGLYASSFPWTFEKIFKGETVALNVKDLPPEAKLDKQTFSYCGIKSTAIFPLKVGGKDPFGIIGFDYLKSERIWADSLLHRLQMVAQLFTHALSRKHWEIDLREKEERLSLTIDAAEAGLLIADLSSGHIWANHKCYKKCILPIVTSYIRI
jgi:formate hydrogenlyase transcriptional activator